MYIAYKRHRLGRDGGIVSDSEWVKRRSGPEWSPPVSLLLASCSPHGSQLLQHKYEVERSNGHHLSSSWTPGNLRNDDYYHVH